VELDDVVLERRTGHIIPDVVCVADGRELFVEIAVTHPVEAAKVSTIREMGVSAIEVNLSNEDRASSKQHIEAIIVNGTNLKKWLFHSPTAVLERELRGKVEALPLTDRGLATHADNCPLPAREWRGKPYANVMWDCPGCIWSVDMDSEYQYCAGRHARPSLEKRGMKPEWHYLES